MKATLIKKADGWYNLYQDNIGIGSTHSELQGYKLSKQNCDEIFGIYQPSELSKVLTEGERGAFEFGYCLAREHNSHKVFTLEQMVDCWNTALKFQENELTLGEFIQSLRPTEIEVEVEMEVADLAFYENGERYPIEANIPERFKYKPKLDSEGCLILKKTNVSS
jgi:hypothetical protein